jgi:hypothetical protein
VADDDQARGDAGALRDGYERLRTSVLAGGASRWRLGHGVLSVRGMTAWMSTFGELAPPVNGTAGAAPSAVVPASAGCEPPAGLPLALPDADQVVAVLTQMVLPLAA